MPKPIAHPALLAFFAVNNPPRTAFSMHCRCSFGDARNTEAHGWRFILSILRRWRRFSELRSTSLRAGCSQTCTSAGNIPATCVSGSSSTMGTATSSLSRRRARRGVRTREKARLCSGGVEAVASAVALQQAMAQRNATLAEAHRIELRIGINLGDIVTSYEDVHGDGVNVTSRLEPLAEPGGICISATVHEHVRAKLAYPFEDRGVQTLKNIAEPVRVYAQGQPPILTSSNPLSTLHRRFACARLSQPCLPESCPGVSATLTTIAFDNSSLRWLEINT